MFTLYDYIVVAGYFVFLIITGIITRKLISNTSDYFRGSGRMLWWMVGSSAFLVQFSAWTFTGAAGEAYLNGPIVITIFFGNALGFLANYFFFAPKFRQMRVISAMQAVEQRFGRSGEQFYTWAQVPLSILNSGIWLVGLSIFVSSVFGIPLEWIIFGVGVTITICSTLGGSWAVVSSDFIQMLILMMVAIVMAYFSLSEVGGVTAMIQQFPVESLLGDNYNYPAFIIVWAVIMIIAQFFKTNHILDANRYLNAKNSTQARKAALLASVLFFIGPIIWFIPPIAARILIPDMSALFPELNNPAEAAYIAVALNLLPQGMVGLLLAGMFAATMTSMDSGLNKNAGIIVKNVYLSLIKPDASEVQQMFIAKISTVLLGVVVIGVALFYSTLKDLALFDLMITIGSLLGLPVAVPLVLGLLIRKTPDWSGWSTTVVGLMCSAAVKFYFNADWFEDVFGLDMLARDTRYWNISLAVIINITIPVLWFFGSMKFYKEPSDKRKTVLQEFWNNQQTPVEEIEDASSDIQQYKLIGGFALAYGIFVFCLSLIPNPIQGRIIFLICGFFLTLLGSALYLKSKKHRIAS